MFGRKSGNIRKEQGVSAAQVGNAVAIREPDREQRLARAQDMAQRIAAKGDDGDGFVLIGKGTHIKGEIGNCSVVEIQGTLEGNISASILIVREGGAFRGEIQAEQAEIHGLLDGRATVHGLLDVRASGRVTGDVTYETLSVAAGAHLAGRLQMPATIDGGGMIDAEGQPVDSSESEARSANGHAGHTNGFAAPRN